MIYVRYPLPLRNVEDSLLERGIDVCHETVRLFDEVGVSINGEMGYFWPAPLKPNLIGAALTPQKAETAIRMSLLAPQRERSAAENVLADDVPEKTK